MNKEVLKQIIIENNDFINSIDKILERKVEHLNFSLNKCVVLYGPRRTGKTYILYSIYKKNPQKILYIDFEDDRLSDFTVKDFQILKESFFELNPDLLEDKEVIFLFDEIQNVFGWEKFVRRIVEKDNIKVVVTGSSSKMMPREIHTSLRGRSLGVRILPLSFKEILEIKEPKFNNDWLYNKKKVIVNNYLTDYLKYGGFPEVILADNKIEKEKILVEYLDAMFFKDLVERYKISNIDLLDLLRDILFSFYSQRCSMSSIYKKFKDKISFSKDTLFKYYNNFLESMLVFDVKQFTDSAYKRKRNPAKIYLVDNGLCKNIKLANYGRLLENIVYLKLLRNDNKIFYFSNGYECDFVISKENEKGIYQVCWELTDQNREREIMGLSKTAKQLKLKEANIITNNQTEVIKNNNIKISVFSIKKFLLKN